MYTKIQVYFQNMHFNKKENFILEKLTKTNIPDISILLWEKRKRPSSWRQLNIFYQRKEKFTYGKSLHLQRSGTHSGFRFPLVQNKSARPNNALLKRAQGRFLFLLVDLYFNCAILRLLNGRSKWHNDYWDLIKFLEIHTMQLQIYDLTFVFFPFFLNCCM